MQPTQITLPPNQPLGPRAETLASCPSTDPSSAQRGDSPLQAALQGPCGVCKQHSKEKQGTAAGGRVNRCSDHGQAHTRMLTTTHKLKHHDASSQALGIAQMQGSRAVLRTGALSPRKSLGLAAQQSPEEDPLVMNRGTACFWVKRNKQEQGQSSLLHLR